MHDISVWIEQYHANEKRVRNERVLLKIARAIYPTAWGYHTPPDAQGVSHIVEGFPATAQGYAKFAFDAIESELK